MRSLFLGLGLLLAVFLSPYRAEAQAIVLPCVPSGTSCIPVSAANPLPTTSAITAGTTMVTCTSGTTGVLFQSSGKVECNSSFTTDGAGSVSAGSFNATSSINISGGAAQVLSNGVLYAAAMQAFGSAPTATAGSCVGGTVTGAPAAGTFVAPVCGGGTIILTFPAGLVTNGWVCDIKDRTTPADAINQTASSATTATFTATTVNLDVLQFKCTGY